MICRSTSRVVVFARRAREVPDTQKKTAMKNGSPRGFVGFVGVQEVVEEVMGVSWMCSASTETVGVYGSVDGELPVSRMVAAALACSRHKERVGELDLGRVSIAR